MTSSIPSATSPTSTSIESPASSSGSKAWIAGAVIGPVAGCAIIGALGFWLARRNRRNKQSVPNDTPTPNLLPPGTGISQYQEARELAAREAARELESSNRSPVELPASSEINSKP